MYRFLIILITISCLLFLDSAVRLGIAEPRKPARPKTSIKPIPDLLEEANRCIKEKRYHAAIQALTTVLNHSPDSVEAYRLRGIAFDRLGEYAQAISDLTRYIEHKPGNPEGYLLRADARTFSGDPETALQDYEKAIRLAPSLISAYLGRGLALTALHRYDEAIKDYQWVLALESGNTEALVNIGIACKLAGRYPEAVGYLEKALSREQDPEWQRKIEKWIEQIVREARLQRNGATPLTHPQSPSAQPLW